MLGYQSYTEIGGGYVKFGMLVEKGYLPGAAASLMTLGSLEDSVFFAVSLPIAIVLSRSWRLPIFAKIRNQIVDYRQFVIISIVLIILLIILIKSLAERKIFINFISRFSIRAKIINKVCSITRDFATVYRIIGARWKSRLALSLVLTVFQWTARYSVISALLTSFEIHVDPLRFFIFQWIVFICIFSFQNS